MALIAMHYRFIGLSERAVECARTSELLFAVPAVGADLRRIDADRLDHALERLIAQRVEAHIFANGLEQAFSAFGRCIGVFLKVLLTFIAFELLHHAARDQIHLGFVAREVQILAVEHDGRAGRPHVHCLRAGAIEELDRFAQLRTAHDGVVHEQELLVLDELGHRDLLELRHLVAHVLVLRHERTLPGGRVLDERAAERSLALGRVADGMRCARIGDSCHVVELGDAHLFGLVARHDRAVAVTHDLDIHAFVGGRGIAIVGPEEGADLHVFASGRERFVAISRDVHDLGGAQFVDRFVIDLLVGERLEGRAIAFVILADEHRQAAEPIARGDDVALFGHEQQRHGAFDLFLHVLDARNEIVFLIDERCDQFGLVHFARAHGHELVAMIGEVLFDERVGVVDHAAGGERKHA